jgi:hypothetical protein
MEERDQISKNKAVERIREYFAREFKAYFGKTTHEQRLRGQTFICSVCTKKGCDNQGHSTEHKWLAVYSANRAVGCQFPHTICTQDAHDVDSEANIEEIRAAVEREWDYIKDVDSLN